MDRLTSMNVFVKSADIGSFAAAANALQMSPQMVAKHVAHLEDRLGTSLINRTTRRQSLTDVGRAYYDRCKVVLAEAEIAEATALDMKTQPTGVLRVNAPVTFGSYSLAPFVTRYLAQYPKMSIDLTLNDRAVDPLEEGYEVLLRIGDIGDNSLISHALKPYRLIACAAPDYLARHGTPQTPADLEAHACLTYGTWSPSLPCRWQFRKNGKSEEVKAAGRLRSNDWKALLHAALEGYGITLGPEDVLEREIAAGRLVQVLRDYQGPARPMHVLYPAGRQPTAKIRSFVNAVVEAFSDTPNTEKNTTIAIPV